MVLSLSLGQTRGMVLCSLWKHDWELRFVCTLYSLFGVLSSAFHGLALLNLSGLFLSLGREDANPWDGAVQSVKAVSFFEISLQFKLQIRWI